MVFPFWKSKTSGQGSEKVETQALQFLKFLHYRICTLCTIQDPEIDLVSRFQVKKSSVPFIYVFYTKLSCFPAFSSTVLLYMLSQSKV